MKFKHLIEMCSVVALSLPLTTTVVFGQAAGSPLELKLNEAHERELANWRTHAYRVTLDSGDFIQVVVEQQGIDVALSIHSSDDAQLAEMDSSNGKYGYEILSFVAGKAGEYLIKIRRLKKAGNPEAGKYNLTLRAKRKASARDAERLEAEKRFRATNSRNTARTEEAQAEYKKLLPLWRELDEKFWVILTLELIDSVESIEEASGLYGQVGNRKREQDLFVKLGRKHYDARAWEKSRAAYEKALTVAQERNETEAIGRINALIRQVGDRKTFEEKFAIFRSMVLAGQGLSDLGRKREAIAEFTKASEYAQANERLQRWALDAQEMIGQTYMDLKEFDHAKETFRKALDYARAAGFVGYEIQYVENLERVINESRPAQARVEPVVRTGHTQQVWTVGLSPNGKLLASGGFDSQIKLWDVASGRELRTLSLHRGAVRAVAFSADGEVLASASDDSTIMLWDVMSGVKFRTLTGHLAPVWWVTFSRDGGTIASGDQAGRIKLWDRSNGELLNTLNGNPHGVWSVAFSPDRKTLASAGNDGMIQLWDISNLKQVELVKEISAHESNIFSVKFTWDGKLLASGGKDGLVKLWNVKDAKAAFLIKEIRAHTDGSPHNVRSVDFSPDGKTLLSGSEDSTVKSWNVTKPESPELLNTFTVNKHRSGGVYSVAFSRDGEIVAAGNGAGTVDLLNGHDLTRLRNLTRISSEIRTVNISPDLKLLSVGYVQSDVHLWSLDSGSRLAAVGSVDWIWRSLNQFRNFNDDWNVSAFSGNGKRLAINTRSGIEVRDLENKRSYLIPTRDFTEVINISLSPDGEQLAASWHKEGRAGLTLWSVADGKELPAPEPRPAWINFKPGFELTEINGKQILIYPDEAWVKFVEVETGELVASLYFLGGNGWAVVDAKGRWDASDGAQGLMYYSLVTPEGYETIEFSQLKERYYEPGLLPKLLGYNKQALKDVEQFKDILLPPKVEPLETDDARATVKRVKLTNRNGGIGRVQVFVNGREVIIDARDDTLRANPNIKEYVLSFDLKGTSTLPGQVPNVEVVAWNYDDKAKERFKGYVSGRGVKITYRPVEAKPEPTTLFAIIGGVSDYQGEQLDLRFAAKDAEDMYQAIRLGGKNLFGSERVKLKLLTTSRNPAAVPPTKENFRKAFEEFAGEAKPGDVLLVYLSGHGITLDTGGNAYYYLTQEAATTARDALSKDSKLLESSTISSEELTQWHKRVNAQKQLLILDTCAAGAIDDGFKIVEKRELSSDAKRALEDMRDRVGLYVLMGSAADAVSYEASRFGQGLLTYSLLAGMKGQALRPDGLVDVGTLFNYAVEAVPGLAKDIGGIQRPVIRIPQNASSFSFGLITPEDMRLIPLSAVKPMILRPSFLNQTLGYDNLKVTGLVRDRLRRASRGGADGKVSAGFGFLNVDEMPGAIMPAGTYVVEGESVKVTVNLLVDDRPPVTVTLKGSKNDLPALSDRILEAVGVEAQKLNALTIKNGK